MRPSHLLLWLAVPLVSTACADRAPLPTAADEPALAKLTVPAVVDGRVGQAHYRMHVPANWNGRLILYAHGYQTPAEGPVLPFEDPILAPVFEAMRQIVVDQLGYALAYSSYRASGFALQEGVQATHQLRGIFSSKFGKPSRIYLAGHSLGGMVALTLAETHPTHYDAALVLCSFPGGSRAEVDYIFHTRAVFDAFYPSGLPGSLYDGVAKTLPDFLAQDVPGILSVLLAPGGDVGVTAAVLAQQTRLPGRNVPEYVSALINALYFHHTSADDLLARTHGQPFFDNQSTVYAPIAPLPGTGPLFDFLNVAVERSTSTPAAERYIDRLYEPTGALEIPVLTVHSEHDPVTPSWHEQLYDARVDAAGASANLRQWIIPGFGHCDAGDAPAHAAFTVATVEALGALTAWVEAGVDPGERMP